MTHDPRVTLAALCDRNAAAFDRLAYQWRHQAERLRSTATPDPWTTVMVDEVVPGDRIIWAAVECDVIGTAVAAGRYVLTLDWPQTHGGTAAKVVRCQTPAAVQARQDLHERLVAAWDGEQDHADQSHAVAGVS